MSNLKFDIDGKDISSKEINSGKKDFNTFYNNYTAKTKAFYQKGWFWASTGLASLLIASGLLYTSNNEIDTASKFENETIISSATNSLDKKMLPFVNPPIKGIDVPWESLLVDAAKGGVVTNKRGSKISFPALAFITQEGATIEKGKVEIRYREFMDQIDQIVSGIPMTYDSAGTSYQFLSAGMMEVKGFVGEQEVLLAKEKNVTVDLVSNYAETDYNLYQLKPQERNWECMGKDKVVKEPSTNPTAEDNKKVDAILQKTPEFKKLNKKKINIQSELTTIQKAKPTAPRKANKDIPKVDFDFDSKDYPELADYSKVMFQLDEGQKINKHDADRIWNDVQIEKVEDKYKITFTETPTGYQASYITNPVYEGKSFQEASEIFNEKHELYAQKLKAKKAIYNNIKGKIATVRNAVNNDYFNAQNNTSNLVTRVFTINEFGTYNCDKPIAKRRFETGKSPVNLITYNKSNHQRESVFYVNSDKNTYLNRYLIEGETLRYRKKGNNFLIIVKGKEFGFINSDEFKKMAHTKNGNFDFNNLKTANSLKDLKRQLKFNL